MEVRSGVPKASEWFASVRGLGAIVTGGIDSVSVQEAVKLAGGEQVRSSSSRLGIQPSEAGCPEEKGQSDECK